MPILQTRWVNFWETSVGLFFTVFLLLRGPHSCNLSAFFDNFFNCWQLKSANRFSCLPFFVSFKLLCHNFRLKMREKHDNLLPNVHSLCFLLLEKSMEKKRRRKLKIHFTFEERKFSATWSRFLINFFADCSNHSRCFTRLSLLLFCRNIYVAWSTAFSQKKYRRIKSRSPSNITNCFSSADFSFLETQKRARETLANERKKWLEFVTNSRNRLRVSLINNWNFELYWAKSK